MRRAKGEQGVRIPQNITHVGDSLIGIGRVRADLHFGGGWPAETSIRVAPLKRCNPAMRLLVAEDDAAAIEIVRRHFDGHLVTRENADAVLAHLAGNGGQQLMSVVESDAEHRAREDVGYDPFKF